MWKLKLDDKGNVVVQDGKPVYIDGDGKETTFDAGQMHATITRQNGEAQRHREAKEAAEAALKVFDGLDAAEARKALDTLKNVDLSKLGNVEQIRKEVSTAYDRQLEEVRTSLGNANKELTTKYGDLEGKYHNEKIAAAFGGSKFVTDKLAIPTDLVQAKFGGHFKVEEGKLVGYDANNGKIYGRTNPGELASFDEALETLVERYPSRDQIMKGTGNNGNGTKGVPGGGAGKTMSRASFDALPPADRAAYARTQGNVVTD